MGLILGIAASYREDVRPGEPFLRADRSVSRTKKFFGDGFMASLGGKGFASTRANKAYLQGIEMSADAGDSHARGYMVAALARSHKGGIGALPDVTDIYLRDNAFSGYRPEFIAKEMFERGVFGFVPHLLLEVYGGNDYAALNIAGQTAVIRAVGIRPSGIEEIVRMNEAAMIRSRQVVSEMLAKKADVGQVLQRIAAGEASGKDHGSICVMVSGGFPCAFQDREVCIGCRYEILTKSLMHQLASEFARMRPLVDGPDGWRYRDMIRRLILPAISEYLSCMKEAFEDTDMDFLAEILERGLKGYDKRSEPDGRSGLQSLPGR